MSGEGYRVTADTTTGEVSVEEVTAPERDAAAVSSPAAGGLRLTEAERAVLDATDELHDYPTETDDGVVWCCGCGIWPPAHLLGSQVDDAFWLWRHRQAERYAVVERILADREAARAARVPDREAVAKAVEQGLRSCRVEDAPNPLIHERDLHHCTHMVLVALAPFLAAPADPAAGGDETREGGR